MSAALAETLPASEAPPVLQTIGLTKSYGGLVAVNDVELTLHAGEAHAVIGPNGAGKSSLINLLSGKIAPTAGRIIFNGRNIVGLPPHRITRLGMGRGFQKTNIFPRLTLFENCALAAQSRLSHSMRFFRPASAYGDIRHHAEEALETVGLTGRAQSVASAVSYGEQRQLEIAMVLAAGPKVLVLDEPMAGMGHEESEKVVELLLTLRERYPLLLVEHDMDAVFSIAKRLTVMVNGRVIASGPTAEVRDSAEVQEAYLGDGRERY